MPAGEIVLIVIGVLVFLSPVFAGTISALKGRVAFAVVGAFLVLFAAFGVLADLNNTEPGLSGMGGMAAGALIMVFGWIPLVGSLLSARPDSWWWNHRYSAARRTAITAAREARKQARSPGSRDD